MMCIVSYYSNQSPTLFLYAANTLNYITPYHFNMTLANLARYSAHISMIGTTVQRTYFERDESSLPSSHLQAYSGSAEALDPVIDYREL